MTNISKKTAGAASKALSLVLKLLFPARCPLCGCVLTGKEQYVCAGCREKLPFITDPYCLRCGRPIRDETKEYCPQCEKVSRQFDEGRCTFRYEGALRDALLDMKFKNRREYIPFFAAAMASRNRAYLQRNHFDMIIPVPLHPRKKAERGFDQCALIGRELSEQTGIPLRCGILKRVRYTSPQKTLNARERSINLEGAFAVNEGTLPPGARVLLIDDILTTGATLSECSRVLKKSGAGKVGFLALSAPEI